MEWVTENWLFILFAVIFIGMHLTGHGCCGSHGKHGDEGDGEHKHSDDRTSEKKGDSSCH